MISLYILHVVLFSIIVMQQAHVDGEKYVVKCKPGETKIANLDDLYTFYECKENGLKILHQCPPDERFNTTLQKCHQYEEDSNLKKTRGYKYGGCRGRGCRGGKWGPGKYRKGWYRGAPPFRGGQFNKNSNINNKHKQYHNKNIINNNNNNNNQRPNNWGNTRGEINCSIDQPGGPPKYIPNTDDCSTFYTCNMGRPILTHCSRGLYFHPGKGSCDNYMPNGWCRMPNGFKPGGAAIYE